MADNITERINTTFLDIPKPKLKAYIITDKNCDAEGQLIVWAMSSGMAKAKGLQDDLFDSFDFIELRAERKKSFDKYSDTQRVPIKELLDIGWWFYCANCSGIQISEDDIELGKAFIGDEDDDYCSFVKGYVICNKCKQSLSEKKEV